VVCSQPLLVRLSALLLQLFQLQSLPSNSPR
jgi:hypothetical protein